MKFLYQLISLLFVMLLSVLALAVNLVDGSILYKESCIRCHGNDIQKEIVVDNIEELKGGINMCVNALNLPWNQTDINDTAGYLDAEYFHFDKSLKVKTNGKN